jgi:hypothetical protein
MLRNAYPTVDVPDWVEASTTRPCPVCGGTDGCSILEDGEFVRCLEVVCDWPVVTGGWLHRVRDREGTRT